MAGISSNEISEQSPSVNNRHQSEQIQTLMRPHTYVRRYVLAPRHCRLPTPKPHYKANAPSSPPTTAMPLPFHIRLKNALQLHPQDHCPTMPTVWKHQSTLPEEQSREHHKALPRHASYVASPLPPCHPQARCTYQAPPVSHHHMSLTHNWSAGLPVTHDREGDPCIIYIKEVSSALPSAPNASHANGAWEVLVR